MNIEDKIAQIEPYTDEQVEEAVRKMAMHPEVFAISKFLFPDEPAWTLRNLLKDIHTADEFQRAVMEKAVEWVIDNTTKGLTYSGIEGLKEFGGKFLAMSNHRDIVLDPAFTQYVLVKNEVPMTDIAVGDNLLANKMVEYLLRCNRMITVIRGISARELYLSSQALSNYIRSSIVSGRSSVWIAQRQGRTKNGEDITEQGLLKMFDMSGTKSFEDNFKELNIIPLSISYEFEPCDIRKAREMLISRTKKYVKKPHEDTHSIIIGIRQKKGNVHLSFGNKISDEVIERAAAADKRDRYAILRGEVDRQVIEGYKLWPTNYIAYDKVNNTTKYSDFYNKEDVEAFEAFTEHKLDKVEKSLDRDELREIFLRIYSNPVVSKEKYL